MFCQKCGNQIPDDAQFCPKCGFAFGAANVPATQPVAPVYQQQAAPNYQQPAPPANTDKKKKGIIIGAVVAVAVIALAVILIVVLGGKDSSGSSSTGSNAKPSTNDSRADSADGESEQDEYVWSPAKTLSSDYRSGQIEIGGVVYGDLPIRGKEFMEQGWKIKNSYDDEDVEADEDTSVSLVNGSAEIMADFHNYLSEDAPLTDCYIYMIRVSKSFTSGDTVVLPGGLDFASSAYEDFISEWGKASYDGIAAGGSDTIVHYYFDNYDDYYGYSLKFDDDHALTSVTLLNENEPTYVASSGSSNAGTASQQDKVEDEDVADAGANSGSVSSEDSVNLSALRSVENKDDCPVKIVSCSVAEDYYKGTLVGFGESGYDALVFDISNNSGSDVKEVVYLAIGYTDSNEPVKIGGTITLFNYDPYLLQFTTQNVTISSGETEKFGVRCDADDISGVSAIVYSYTTTDGKEHMNSMAEEWVENLYS